MVIGLKDLKERMRDRSAIILAIVVPLGLAFIFNLILGPLADEEFVVPLTVYDGDGGTVAAGFVELVADLESQGFATVTVAESEAAARRLVTDNEVSAAFIVPEGFSSSIQASQAADIVVVANPDAPIGTQVATAIATGYTEEINAVGLSVGTALASGGTHDDVAALIESARQQADPVGLGDPQAVGSGLDLVTFYAMGMAVFFLFFSVQFGILSLIDEREAGTMTRLLAAPISKPSILLGKLFASFVVGVVATVVLWLATTLLMGADWGGWFGVLLLIVAGVVAAMGVTALVATFTRSAEQAGAITAFIVVVMGLLGGTFFPISQAAGFLGVLSRLTPHYWLVEGFQNLSAGDGLADILPSIGAILLFAVLLGGIGLLRARRLVQT
jgi:ABC-2 type transport system permease protein